MFVTQTDAIDIAEHAHNQQLIRLLYAFIVWMFVAQSLEFLLSFSRLWRFWY